MHLPSQCGCKHKAKARRQEQVKPGYRLTAILLVHLHNLEASLCSPGLSPAWSKCASNSAGVEIVFTLSSTFSLSAILRRSASSSVSRLACSDEAGPLSERTRTFLRRCVRNVGGAAHLPELSPFGRVCPCNIICSFYEMWNWI
ncbi:hypothetical protein DUNSADRAFT_2650 [Dunaliella salina]|uniref:Encoded protein n=1 Tax=Dunaliella salina TaxID=3046 RepID=A0ABQ7H857_DUNSA|nr:hypothetical protein DUNSADRAFT_2650 [Dunaliella salina]|eukprot:KAF5843037.1 hypothetical protein DUNSADRAFT_2650 [Dunaliella salina]